MVRWSTLVVAIGLAMVSMSAGPGMGEDGDPALGRRLDEYAAALNKLGPLSGSILIARDGKVLASRGYGMANLELEVANTPRMKFRIASTTKPITATAVLLLQEAGELNVRDAIGKYLKGCPEEWTDITIRHLLNQTSGLPDLQQFPDYDKSRRLFSDAESFLLRMKAEPVHFRPGERFEYSNTNFVLLGYIIEAVSKESYETFLRERIFEPLGMVDTGYDHAEPIVPNRASGYVWRGQLVNADVIDRENLHASGGLYSTVEDLHRFARGLHGGKLLSKESLAAMVATSDEGYGYGWYTGRWFDRPIVSHPGRVDGFRSDLVYFPAESLCVVFLSNVENTRTGEVTQSLAALALGQNVPLAEVGSPIDTVGNLVTVTVDPKIFDTYSGRYALPMGTLKITRDGNKLLAEFDNEPKPAELLPESESQFFIRGPAGVHVIFVKDAQGRVAEVKVLVRGREFRGERKD